MQHKYTLFGLGLVLLVLTMTVPMTRVYADHDHDDDDEYDYDYDSDFDDYMKSKIHLEDIEQKSDDGDNTIIIDTDQYKNFEREYDNDRPFPYYRPFYPDRYYDDDYRPYYRSDDFFEDRRDYYRDRVDDRLDWYYD